jgi:hypothetical protein
MIRKLLVASAVAGLLTFGAGAASAQPPQPPQPQWVPVFYFGAYCMQAGGLGQQSGALAPGTWKCDNGWLMVQPPQASQPAQQG